jgi:hypothetical protein
MLIVHSRALTLFVYNCDLFSLSQHSPCIALLLKLLLMIRFAHAFAATCLLVLRFLPSTGPAPLNLEIPPYTLNDGKLIVG